MKMTEAEQHNDSLYTIHIYKTDRRRKAGKRLIKTSEVVATKDLAESIGQTQMETLKACDFKVWKTYLVKTNLLTKLPFQERFDTPNYCSPSCESYFTM